MTWFFTLKFGQIKISMAGNFGRMTMVIIPKSTRMIFDQIIDNTMSVGQMTDDEMAFGQMKVGQNMKTPEGNFQI
jgi:hypothetical protein